MEKELDIARLLCGKREGTLLHSDIFGRCKFFDVEDDGMIRTMSEKHINGRPYSSTEVYLPNGRFCDEGKVLLFPSDKMRDWEKFSWVKGTLLVSNDKKARCLFLGWGDDDYMSFNAVFKVEDGDNGEVEKWLYLDECLSTFDYQKDDDDENRESYFRAVERLAGGRLNRDTLKLEERIVIADSNEVALRPFQQVLVRNSDKSNWCADWFSHTEKTKEDLASFRTVSGWYKQCISYAGHEELLGTNKSE